MLNRTILLSLVAAAGLVAGGNASAHDCMQRSEFEGTINAGAGHPSFPVSASFQTMNVVIAGREHGTVGSVTCTVKPDGTKMIFMKMAAHILYQCNGYVEGTDATGFTANMDCLGSDTSKNTLIGRFRRL